MSLKREASPTETKADRIYIRCTPRHKEKIESAARTLGLSVSDYLLSAALATVEEMRPTETRAEKAEASEALRESATVSTERLSPIDTKRLLAQIFAQPDEPTPRMRQAIQHYNRTILGKRGGISE